MPALNVKTFCKDPLICIANHKHLLLATFLITILVGAVGIDYFLTAEIPWYQALNWSAQTVTSTGYGNVTLDSAASWNWSTFMMMWGVPVMLSLVVAYIVDSVRKHQTAKSEAHIHEIKCEMQTILREMGIEHKVDYSENGDK